MPADWCQIHHLDDWITGGETDINRMALACTYNHLTSIPEGWECIMINGIPHWKPSAWLNPNRTPIRNTANHPALRFEMPAVFGNS